MADYTYLFADLRTDEILGELPLDGVRFGEQLKGAGAWNGVLPLGDPKIARLDWQDWTEKGKRAVYIDRDGALTFGGIVWTRRYQTAGDEASKLQLAGNGFWSYFARRVIHTLLTFASTDQADIVAAIVNALQAETAGTINVAIDDTTTDVLRDRTYYAYELKNGAEAVEQLAAVINGFDFRIVLSGDSTHPVKTLEIGYPRLGVEAIESPLVFDRPGNIRDYDWPEDATRMATRSFAIGAGEGDDMLLATSTASAALDDGYPLLDLVVSYKDVREVDTLQEHAAADVAASGYPVLIPTLTVRGDAEPEVGSYHAGDDCRLVIQDERFPDGIDAYARIIAFTVSPPTGETLETAEISLGEVEIDSGS